MSRHGITLIAFLFMIQWFSVPGKMAGFERSISFIEKRDCDEVVKNIRAQKNALILVTNCYEVRHDVVDKTPVPGPPAALSYDPKVAPAHPEQ